MNVLVVDDDREIVDSISIFLSGEGYKALKAYDGIEALDILSEHSYFARSYRGQAQNHFHNRGFACTVTPQQTVHPSFSYMKINTVDGFLPTINLCQLCRFNHKIIHS